MGSRVLLQGTFPTQGLNPALLCLLHRRQILHHWATREALVCNVVLLKLLKFINPCNEYWIPIISRVLYTVNDIDIDKCFVLFLSFQRNLYLHSGLKDSMCSPSTVCFLSKYKQFYPFQFILVTSSRSLISIQIHQNLSLEIFLNFLFSLILHSLISTSYFPAGHQDCTQVNARFSSLCHQPVYTRDHSVGWGQAACFLSKPGCVFLMKESKCIPEKEGGLLPTKG